MRTQFSARFASLTASVLINLLIFSSVGYLFNGHPGHAQSASGLAVRFGAA